MCLVIQQGHENIGISKSRGISQQRSVNGLLIGDRASPHRSLQGQTYVRARTLQHYVCVRVSMREKESAHTHVVVGL